MISLCHFDSIDFRFVLCSVRVFFFILLRLRLFGCFYFLLIYLLLICLALFPWFERTVTKNSRMNLKCGRLLWLQLRALLLTGGCLSVFGWCVPFNWHCTTQRATLPMQSANNRTLCVLCFSWSFYDYWPLFDSLSLSLSIAHSHSPLCPDSLLGRGCL